MNLHPTPVHIRSAFLDVLAEDMQNPQPFTPPMPVRTLELLNKAISRACAEHDRETNGVGK